MRSVNLKILVVAILLFSVLVAPRSYAAIITVDCNGSSDFSSIQEAIDNARAYDTIVVYPCVYYENINFRGKSITVTGTDPDNINIVQATVIDANNVEFHSKLLDICNKSRSMIMISAYDNDLYRKKLDLKHGWTVKRIETHTRDTTGKDFARTEVLWMNEAFIKAKKNNRVPIRLNKNEKANKKINPPRK